MVNQGDIIKLEGIQTPGVVISKDFYNESGSVILCPIIKKTVSNMCFSINYEDTKAYVQCDNVRMIDLSSRFYSVKGRIKMDELIEIIGITTSILDLI